MACSGRTGKEVSAFKSAEACATELSGNCAELNRQTQEVEHLATYGKQTTAICSNRQKIQFCETQKVSVLPSLLKIGRRSFWMLIGALLADFTTFLPGSARNVEIAVTHSKQSPA